MTQIRSIFWFSIFVLFASFEPSLGLAIDKTARRYESFASSIIPRNIYAAGHSLYKRIPKIIFSSSTSVSTSSSITITIGGKKETTTSQDSTKYSGSPTLGNTAGHVSLSQVAGLVSNTKKSTCKGKGGIVSFKAETTETEKGSSFKSSCSVKSTTNGILTSLVPKKCSSPTVGIYWDPVLKTAVRKVNDCNVKQQTFVYRDPELGKDVALYQKGDFTIRRFYEGDSTYKSIAYFVGCATNGTPAQLGTSKKRKLMHRAVEKRGFFRGNTKDPIWNCSTPNADTVGGPKDSFMFAPANVGECLVIMASRECLNQDSVAFFWLG
ncbi:hypothetical protein H072_1399 [Dactylellina haptotyla CBS 200.50]|uniref:Ecp2 effector protein domain-containing protein n=1 Tax=Dactylellina haptotyla (strain CBS 200.50) TaxID=1284197 RepID=S8BYS4_DACHA|nr:hypothetical protein H072_1399 [Dactylellina haptotyla CBS 200.50]